MDEKKTKLPSETAELSDEALDEVSGGENTSGVELVKCVNCGAVYTKNAFEKLYHWLCPRCGNDPRYKKTKK